MNRNICDDKKMLLDRTLNGISLQDISSVKSLKDVHIVNRHFVEAKLKLTDQEILDECRKIKKNTDQLKILKTIPKIEQRSEEWYNARQTLITASDYGQALGKGKFGTQRDFFRKKCGYEEEQPLHSSILKHGVRYEPVATRFYELLMNTKVHEFGLLRHPKYDFLGASPDGVTDQARALEIKCPSKRKITGEIAEQYFLQIQGQLDVMNLEACDFLECQFEEYLDEFDFDLDWNETYTLSKSDEQKGVIIEFDGEMEPIYSDPGISKKRYKTWLKERIRTLHSHDFVLIYYKLTKYSLQTVQRDDKFINENNEKLSHAWDTIVKYKKNKDTYNADIGQHSPKKRVAKCLFQDIDEI